MSDDRAVEAVRVAAEQRAVAAVHLDAEARRPVGVERDRDRGQHAGVVLEHRGHARGLGDLEARAVDRGAGLAHAGRQRRHPPDRAEELDRRADGVRADVEQRPGELGVEERGGGMPALGRRVQQPDRRDRGRADPAFVDRGAQRLDAGAEERVRRAADEHAGRPARGASSSRASATLVASGFSV